MAAKREIDYKNITRRICCIIAFVVCLGLIVEGAYNVSLLTNYEREMKPNFAYGLGQLFAALVLAVLIYFSTYEYDKEKQSADRSFNQLQRIRKGEDPKKVLNDRSW